MLFRSEKDLVFAMKDQGVTALSLEMIPRSTRAQKLDVLSSQANLAGYAAVIEAVNHLDKICPMMMTPAGTISPAKVFIIGAGVAGLQAIATAKRLGARVEAFDTRPVVEEQVQSLGAKFVKVSLQQQEETGQGYAKELSKDDLKKQQDVMAKHCAKSDIVITTAQVFGRQAPRIVTLDMIKGMQRGSVMVDMAVATGGNIEGSVKDKMVVVDGISVIGYTNLASKYAFNASQMFASNIYHLLALFFQGEDQSFGLDFDDDIVKQSVITYQGQIVNERIMEAYSV